MRLTKSIFHDTAIIMVAFGLLVGGLFLAFVTLFGVSTDIAFSPAFIGISLGAGVLVGIFNYLIVRRTVGEKIRTLAVKMGEVRERISEWQSGNEDAKCMGDSCSVDIRSNDEIGACADSFNNLFETLATTLQTQSAVQVFNTMLTCHLDLSRIVTEALEQLLSQTHAIAGAVLIEKQGELEVACTHGFQGTDDIANNDYVHNVVKKKRRMIIDLPEDLHISAILTVVRPRQILVAPIINKGAVQGAILLASAGVFSREGLTRLDLFEKGFGLAINNARIHEQLQRLAALDSLTGLYNRRFGMDRLQEEFGRSQRSGLPLGLLMLDIDHFKNFNDTYGHLVGDKVIIAVAKSVRALLREGDVMIRYGGEEFLVVAPAASNNDAKAIGERIRRVVEETVVPYQDKQLRVTVSIGVASYPELEAENKEALIKAADDALYLSKDRGRNRVTAAQ